MTPNQTRNFAGSAAQFFLGGLALALVTLIFHQIHADIATTAFADLVVILLFSLIGSFAAAVLLCLLSVVGLILFFAPPGLSFVVDDPRHIVVVAAFCVTAVMVAWLIGTVRRGKDVAQEAEAKLRRSQAELRNSEREWREVFEHNPVMYFMVDADSTVRNVNSFGAAQLGYTVAELAGRSVLNVFLDEDRALVRKCIAECLETVGQSHTWEIRKIRKDGSVLWVRENAKAMRRADDSLVVLIACEDVTERRQTERALQQSEQRFRDYAETASDWLWETGPDHRVTHLHAHTVRTPAPAAIGELRWEIASDFESEPEKWREHRKTLEAHLPFRDLVYRTDHSTGSSIYVRASGKPVFDANGQFLGYRGVSTDITASIRAEQAERALRRAQAELAHVTRVTTLGELTTSIAHEINQPLAAVVANAEACLSWLDRNPADLDAARRSVEWIVEDGNRASEVIRRVRALAQKTEIERIPLDINEVASDVMALVQRELSSHKVSAKLELAPHLPPILGDRIQLQQVIINLVINAVEAMESLSDRPRLLTIGSGRHEMDRVFLTVADNGIGIPPGEAERMFTPFFTTKSSGMGMGLSICRSIVEAHEGRLSASRNEDGGTVFQFVMPVHKGDQA
jgi:PAS domain S-box-containing protein